MLRKTIILWLLLAGIQVLAQDSIKTKVPMAYAIVELSRKGYYDDETVLVYSEDGKTDTLTDKLFYSTDVFFKNFPLADRKKNYKITIPKKALLCIKYMEEKNYSLVSSTVTSSSYWLLSGSVNSYSYQYIFRKNEK